jgi:hypothetical protein
MSIARRGVAARQLCCRRSKLVDYGCRSSKNMPHLSDRTKPEAITRTTGPSSLPSINGFSLYPFSESVHLFNDKTIPTIIQHILGAPNVVDAFSTIETITTFVQHTLGALQSSSMFFYDQNNYNSCSTHLSQYSC